MQTKTASIIIADDHAIVRNGLREIIASVPHASLIAEADNGLTAIALVKQHCPDLLIVDAAMPLAKGIEVLSDARRWSPDTRIILFTGFTASGILAEWLQSGVDGLLIKSSPPERIAAAITTVLGGANYIDPAAQDILTAAEQREPLTARECEVLSLIASGHRNQSIAERLSISKRTVEKHRSSLMGKLDVSTTGELMAYALREGLLDEFRQL